MKMAILTLVSTCCLSTLAFADGPGQKDIVGTPAQRSSDAQIMSFGDLKAACESPARFHNQVAPQNIQISCQESQYKWVPDTAGTVTMQTARQVTVSVISDKYSVSPFTTMVDSAPQLTACPQFKQVLETVSNVTAMSCADIAAFSGSGTDYCSSSASLLRAANPAGITSQDTGRVISLCSTIKSRDDRGQRNQGQK